MTGGPFSLSCRPPTFYRNSVPAYGKFRSFRKAMEAPLLPQLGGVPALSLDLTVWLHLHWLRPALSCAHMLLSPPILTQSQGLSTRCQLHFRAWPGTGQSCFCSFLHHVTCLAGHHIFLSHSAASQMAPGSSQVHGLELTLLLHQTAR